MFLKQYSNIYIDILLWFAAIPNIIVVITFKSTLNYKFKSGQFLVPLQGGSICLDGNYFIKHLVLE